MLTTTLGTRLADPPGFGSLGTGQGRGQVARGERKGQFRGRGLEGQGGKVLGGRSEGTG